MNALFKKDQSAEPVFPKGFDDFELVLGDLLRGERATMGKSLLGVERDLRLKAQHIAAIEDCDASAFESAGFVAGYVRSYAKYLGLDPDWVFKKFCEESGFVPVHDISPLASELRTKKVVGSDQVFVPFGVEETSFWKSINLGTIVSALGLLVLIAVLGYGATQLARSVQKVAMAPVDQVPIVSSQSVHLSAPQEANGGAAQSNLPRIVTLDTPVVTPRDMPIARLDPSQQGVFFTPTLPEVDVDSVDTALVPEAAPVPQVTAPAPRQVSLFATAGVWLSVKTQDGTVLFEDILETGQTVDVPLLDSVAYVDRAGNSGSLYFQIGDMVYGPAGKGTRVAKDIELTEAAIVEAFPQITAENRPAVLQRALDALETRVAAQ